LAPGIQQPLHATGVCMGHNSYRRRLAEPLHYFNLLTRGPSTTRLLNAAQAFFGPPGICKWEGQCWLQKKRQLCCDDEINFYSTHNYFHSKYL